KAQLAEQQSQLERLRVALESQPNLIDQMLGAKPKSLGEVTSLSPMTPAVAPLPSPGPVLPPAMQKTDTPEPSPLSLKIGESYLTPLGFMDLTYVGRSTVSGSGIGTNFGSIPFNNNPATGHLAENRLNPQNSRIGFRFDSLYKGANVTGYFEGDFLGNNPANVAVSSNSDTFRLRLYWAQVKKDKWEVLGGQSWSLLTPNRRGISPLPADLFYTHDIDVNYQAGLVWSRNPGIRFVYHPTKTVSLAIAAENAEQYVGGSGGSTATVPPSLLTAEFSQFNNGNTTLATPSVSPDFIAKIAFDPTPRFHAEIAGLESNFKGFNPLNNQHYTKAGGAGSINLAFELFKGFRLLTNNYWSDGGGRYIFGLAPDLTLKENGDIALIHSGSTVTGAEWTLNNTILYAYYGGIYIGRYTVIDPATGKPVGYGYTGSSNGQNRTIQEATVGFNQTLWKDPKYGAINIMGQYSWLNRSPWYVAVDQPKNAHQNQVYVNLRYTLPGQPPTLK
ncbi:MAG: hypothetical protein JWO80_5828, partial [Bryobacterales bacterium]|nr:hypothetical protein [Bryobacterales bacterium]